MQIVLDAFAESLRALTLLPGRDNSTNEPNRSVWFFLFFPVIGLFFGSVAMLLAQALGSEESLFVAWCVVTTWWLLSGGYHLSDLCKVTNAVTCSGSVNERRELLSRETVLTRSSAIPVLLLTGKILAIWQADKCSPGVLPMLLLLVPLSSRYVAVIFALGADTPQSISLRGARVSQSVVVGISTVFVLVLASLIGITLGLSVIMGCLFAGLLVRMLLDQRLGMVPKLCVGAVIEAAELAGLWLPAILACRFPLL